MSTSREVDSLEGGLFESRPFGSRLCDFDFEIGMRKGCGGTAGGEGGGDGSVGYILIWAISI